jgi:hypothetical protein
MYLESAAIIRVEGRNYETALDILEQYLAVGGDENAYRVIRAYIFDRQGRPSDSSSEISKFSAKSIHYNYNIPGYHYYLRCQSGERPQVMGEIEASGRPDDHKERWIVYCLAGARDLQGVFDSFQRTMARGGNIWPSQVPLDEIRQDPRWATVKAYMDWPILNQHAQSAK